MFARRYKDGVVAIVTGVGCLACLAGCRSTKHGEEALRSEKMSAREQAGYLGPVRTVKCETAEFSTQDGQRVEGARVPTLETFYDRRGNVTEESWYDSSGSLDFRVLFTCDAKGNIREVVRRDAQDNLLEKHVYRYDSKGKATESLSYDSEGKLTTRGQYRHDEKGDAVECVFRDENGYPKNRRLDVQDNKGRRIRTESYDADNTLRWSTLVSYGPDDAGITETSCDYNPDGSLERKTVFVYDARRRLLSESTYAADGSLVDKFQYTYEYEWRGNPVKQTRLKLLQSDGLPAEGGSIYEPECVTHLTLTYYANAATP